MGINIEQFAHRLMEMIPQFARGASRYEHNHLTRGHITMPQLWALEYLSRRDGCPMSELADFLRVSRPAVTGLVDRLIAQGFVEREDVAKDRRKVKVRITPKGKKIVVNIWAQKRQALVKGFSSVSPRDREQYLLILGQVVRILNEEPNRQ